MEGCWRWELHEDLEGILGVYLVFCNVILTHISLYLENYVGKAGIAW